MAIKSLSGTPFIGYLSLSAAATPTNVPVFVPMGSAAYTLKATEKLMVTNITLSSNDSTGGLFTLDTAGGTPTKFVSAYLSSTQFLQPEQIPPGVCVGILGTLLRAQVSAITATKTVEVVIKGTIVST